KLLELFQEWGFRGFTAKVRGAAAAAEKSAALTEKSAPPAQGDLFSAFPESGDTEFPFGANAPGDDWSGNYKLIDTPPKFKAFLKDLKKENRFAIDLETTGLDPLTANLVGIAVCWKAGEAYYLAIRGPAGEPTLDEASVIEALTLVLEDPKVAK